MCQRVPQHYSHYGRNEEKRSLDQLVLHVHDILRNFDLGFLRVGESFGRYERGRPPRCV